MKKILFLLFIQCTLFASEFRELLSSACPGDYIVAESGKMLTLINIHSIAGTLILEEISAPIKNIKKPESWGEWVKNKAPGHSSWSMLEIDLASGEILECYSFSRHSHVQISQKESLLATLFKLPLKPVKEDHRRKIGPTPQSGESDFRKLWLPPLIFEGKAVKEARFNVFEATWPQDDTELGGREVTLYFDQAKIIPLPFWIDAATSHITLNFHVIDSGKNLVSPFASLPRRAPQFVGETKKTDAGLFISLKSPSYFREFSLFAIDVTSQEREIIPVSCTVVAREKEQVTLKIETEDVQSKRSYQWLISPIGYESYAEMSKPFTLDFF